MTDQKSESPDTPEDQSPEEEGAVTPPDPAATAATEEGPERSASWGQGGAAEAEAEAAKSEVAELRDKLLRALAENENLLRRAKREREDTAKYAAANFARDMLAVADNLGRALESVPPALREMEDAAGFLDGVELTERELRATLERHGITRISPLGEKFDHDRHEALFEVPTSDAEPGTVVQVLQDGYVIHDRLLRAARVGVAKALPDGGGSDKDGDGHAVDTTA